ncbi:TetR/AcrR family transcriptional regulator [Streptomyces sp. NBC_01262]|uniref:TetR/AcrR family transcriptional regulator n=1 Tax=Streptomyces sp. NBC_01262 TaxID=2903803 RepID=UPI002E36F608|nr:helix-turn-helix domain-containing protein [Streptomyces sp. NBC_01262]
MAVRSGDHTGRPPLTERRRLATRMEIADEAVRLFVARGVAATTAEDIASAAGVSTRTLWRYFRSKEECVRPLLTEGMDMITERLRDHWRTGSSLAQAFASADDPGVMAAQGVGALRDLVRLSRDEPGLRAIWLETHFDAEVLFARLIAEGTDRSEHDLAVRLEAGMLNAALRIVVEDWALQPGEPAGPPPGEALADALHVMTRFLDPEASPG